MFHEKAWTWRYSQDYKPNLGAAGFYGCSLTLTSTIMRPFGYVLAEVRGESARARAVLYCKSASTEQLFVTCWLFKFGSSRSIPLCISSKIVLYTVHDVNKCVTHPV